VFHEHEAIALDDHDGLSYLWSAHPGTAQRRYRAGDKAGAAERGGQDNPAAAPHQRTGGDARG